MLSVAQLVFVFGASVGDAIPYSPSFSSTFWRAAIIAKLSTDHVAPAEYVGYVKKLIPQLEKWVDEHRLLTLDSTKPLVVRLDGNKVEEGRAILRDAANPLVTLADSMDDGAAKAAEPASK